MTEYDYIITKPPLDENTLVHYGVKGMKWRHHKKRTTRSSRSLRRQDLRFEIPGAKQGQAIEEGIEYLAKKIRKATGLEGVLNSYAYNDDNVVYVEDPLGTPYLVEQGSADYKFRKWIADRKNKKPVPGHSR